MPGSIIAGGALTPIGRLSGELRDFTSPNTRLAQPAARQQPAELARGGSGGARVTLWPSASSLAMRRWASFAGSLRVA